MVVPRVPNPFDDDAQRTARLEAHVEGRTRWVIVVLAGLVVLGAWGVLSLAGQPGSGLVLVPIGLGMLIGGGIQLLVTR